MRLLKFICCIRYSLTAAGARACFSEWVFLCCIGQTLTGAFRGISVGKERRGKTDRAQRALSLSVYLLQVEWQEGRWRWKHLGRWRWKHPQDFFFFLTWCTFFLHPKWILGHPPHPAESVEVLPIIRPSPTSRATESFFIISPFWE